MFYVYDTITIAIINVQALVKQRTIVNPHNVDRNE